MSRNGLRPGPMPRRWLVELRAESDGVRISRGEGVSVWDDEDRRYLDLMNGASALLGHGHADVVAAITEQAARVTGASPAVDLDIRDELIEALSVLVPAPLSHVALCSTSDNALRRAAHMAQRTTGRPAIIATAGIERRMDGVDCVAHGDLAGVERLMSKRVAAVIAEPIHTDSDVTVPPPGYLSVIAGVAKRAGALLIVDETRTALRAGTTLMCAADRVLPDILCLGDGIANGLPIGVVVTRADVAAAAGSAMSDADGAGAPLVCAAAAATLRIACDPAFQAHVGMVGDHLLARLNALRLPEIRAVRGRGLIVVIETRNSARPIVAALRERGVLTAPSGSQRILLHPPLILTRREADAAVEAVAAAILDLRRPRMAVVAPAAPEESVSAPRSGEPVAAARRAVGLQAMTELRGAAERAPRRLVRDLPDSGIPA